MIINDTMTAKIEMDIRAKTLFGCGVLKSDKITISCEEFCFEGTIRCDGECKIYVKKDFDPAIFTKEGVGNFIVIVNPYNNEKHTLATLSHKIDRTLFSNPEGLTEDIVRKHLNDIRQQAFANGIDERTIKREIQKKMKQWSDGSLAQSIVTVSANPYRGYLFRDCIYSGMGAWIAASLACVSKSDSETKFAYGLGAVSFLWLCKGAYQFSESNKIFNAQKAKLIAAAQVRLQMSLENLTWMQEVVEAVFAEPYVSAAKIIKL
jgi:hypothetical protein